MLKCTFNIRQTRYGTRSYPWLCKHKQKIKNMNCVKD